MKITIKIGLDNAAFHDGTFFNCEELRRILCKVVDDIEYSYPAYGKLDRDGNEGTCRDISGNKVGSWVIGPPNTDRR